MKSTDRNVEILNNKRASLGTRARYMWRDAFSSWFPKEMMLQFIGVEGEAFNGRFYAYAVFIDLTSSNNHLISLNVCDLVRVNAKFFGDVQGCHVKVERAADGDWLTLVALSTGEKTRVNATPRVLAGGLMRDEAPSADATSHTRHPTLQVVK